MNLRTCPAQGLPTSRVQSGPQALAFPCKRPLSHGHQLAAAPTAKMTDPRPPRRGSPDSALPGERRLPVDLDPVAVRVEALERRVGRFIVPFNDGDAVSFHAVHQRADVSWPCGLEAGMQERGRWRDVPGRVQRKVEPVCVADDDRTVWVLLGGSRVETEVSRIELPAAPFVANRQPEMVEAHELQPY